MRRKKSRQSRNLQLCMRMLSVLKGTELIFANDNKFVFQFPQGTNPQAVRNCVVALKHKLADISDFLKRWNKRLSITKHAVRKRNEDGTLASVTYFIEIEKVRHAPAYQPPPHLVPLDGIFKPEYNRDGLKPPKKFLFDTHEEDETMTPEEFHKHIRPLSCVPSVDNERAYKLYMMKKGQPVTS